jgi:hypothetical protein
MKKRMKGQREGRMSGCRRPRPSSGGPIPKNYFKVGKAPTRELPEAGQDGRVFDDDARVMTQVEEPEAPETPKRAPGSAKPLRTRESLFANAFADGYRKVPENHKRLRESLYAVAVNAVWQSTYRAPDNRARLRQAVLCLNDSRIAAEIDRLVSSKGCAREIASILGARPDPNSAASFRD